MSNEKNFFLNLIFPVVLVIALLYTQEGLQYYLLSNSNSSVVAEEENEGNSRSLLEEFHSFVHTQSNNSIQESTEKNSFPKYLTILYHNPNLSIFSPPPDFLIL